MPKGCPRRSPYPEQKVSAPTANPKRIEPSAKGSASHGVSACLIVRDEEPTIGRCLSSLAPWVEEICVVDTGSTDLTMEIAREFGATVRQVSWEDDWSLARNVSLKMATRAWILVVDADEELTPAGGSALRKAIESPDRQAFLVSQDNLYGSNEVIPLAIPRLFRNRPEIRYSRRIHESIMKSLIELGEPDLTHSEVHLLHHGYLEATAKPRDKHLRNLAILRKCEEEDPDDLYVLHKLSGSLRGNSEREERIAVLERAVQLSRRMTRARRRTFPFLPLVFDSLASEMCRDGRIGEAIEITREGLRSFPVASDLLFRRGDLARRVGADDDARRYLGARASGRDPSELYVSNPDSRGVMPVKGLIRPAVAADRIEEARQLLENALVPHPNDFQLRRLDVEVRVADATTREDGIARLERMMEDAPSDPEVLLISGQFAWSTDERDTALILWRRVSTEASDAGVEARCLLAIALLSMGDLEGAMDLRPPIVARDLPSAACKLVLAVVNDQPIELDPAFRRDQLLTHVLAILQDLIASPKQMAIERFAANASKYQDVLPRIDELLVEE